MSMTRIQKLRSRRTDPMVKTAKLLNEAYDRIREDEPIVYAIGAMQPIDPEYTAVSYSESDRVQKHIAPAARSKGIEIQFRHQGSVTNDTHIKAHSDIDTLVVHEGFFTVEPPQVAQPRYDGNSVEDLRTLRRVSSAAVTVGFPEVRVDASGARSVSLSGGSLRRDIDLVFANWFNTNDYAQYRQELWRGVNVLDNDKATRVLNLPFLHNAQIETKDNRVDGSMRKIIRLLKSLQYDAEDERGLSSYDIASLIWNMPDTMLAHGRGQELQLMKSCCDYLAYTAARDEYRNGLKVPNGTRQLFGGDGASKDELNVTRAYLTALIQDIEQGLRRSFRKLAEARVEY